MANIRTIEFDENEPSDKVYPLLKLVIKLEIILFVDLSDVRQFIKELPIKPIETEFGTGGLTTHWHGIFPVKVDSGIILHFNNITHENTSLIIKYMLASKLHGNKCLGAIVHDYEKENIPMKEESICQKLYQNLFPQSYQKLE